MKKKLLVVSVVVVLLCAILVFAGVASAASVHTGAGVYFGEYGNLFAGREDQAERLETYGTGAAIVFGTVTDADANSEYGVVIYPKGQVMTEDNALIFPAYGTDANGNFGIAISVSQDLANSGNWNAVTYVKDKNTDLTIGNCDFGNETVEFSTAKFGAPQNLAVSKFGIITWDSIDGVTEYKLQVKWNKSGSTYTDLATVTTNSYDFNTYLKSLSETELKGYSGYYPQVRVMATGDSAVNSAYSVLNNALGSEDNGNSNYSLKVVSTADELKAINVAGLKYIVLADDIDLGNVVNPSDTDYRYSYTNLGGGNHGKINGLGHTLKYVYDDFGYLPPNNVGASFNGLFGYLTSSYGNVVMDIGFDMEIITHFEGDDWHANVIAENSTATFKDCYFKLRGQNNRAATANSRIGLTRNSVSTFENCIFDMVTYGKDGAVRAGGPTYKDCQLSRATSIVNNCTFIMNQTQARTAWTETSGSTVDENSSFVSDFATFVSKWNDETLKNKSALQNAGFDVENNVVTFNGNAIYKVALDAPTNLSASDDSILSWTEVSGAAEYDLYANFYNTVYTKMATVTGTSFDMNTYLASLTEEQLDAINGKVMNVAVVAKDSQGVANSEKAVLSNALKINSGDVIRIAKNLQDLKTYCDTTRNYVILANDIEIGDVTGADLSYTGSTNKYGYIINSTFEGVINGLGRKISYNFDYDGQRYVWTDGVEDTETKAGFAGLFDVIQSSSTRLIALRVEASGSSDLTVSTEDLWWNMLTRNIQCKSYNCHFKLRYMCTNTSVSQKTRTAIAYTGQAGAVILYENCIFDMVTMDKDGNYRTAGSAADAVVNWERSATVTNCAYVAHTATESRSIKGQAFVDFAEFITAWNDNTLSAKQSYIDGGWSVDGDAVKLYGVQVNG